MRFSVFAGTTLAVVLAFASNASANSGGVAGYTGKPTTVHPAGQLCQDCHGGGEKPMVALMGPATLTAGQVAQYSLVVTTTLPKAAGAIAATDGVVLAAVSNLQFSFDEMVQVPGGVATAAGKATFTFTVKAPTSGTAIKLWASGLGANGKDGAKGDNAAQATMNIAITGGSTATDAGVDSGSSGTDPDGGSSGGSGGSSGASSSGSSGGSSGTTSGGTEEDGGSTSSSGGATLPGDEAGGCNVSGTDGYGSALFLGALGMIPLLARRRRAKK